ncbi:MAG: MerR family transcriptional regulator [Oscillospiraceae bacterium]|nr:MerR family transcriptional regulator [Oscillospiraceae bacterium]
MMINEFAKFTGVSVRTLHYYDEIGLLVPAWVDRYSGYRFYDEKSLLRMQEILFYRELDFPLKSIIEILSSPDYDKEKALREQKQLLKLKKERLERLISAIDKAAKGENIMGAFDKTEFEKYKAEAKERWGKTEAFGEYEKKAKNINEENAAAGMEAVLSEFADCMKKGAEPDSEEAQNLVGKLQNFITENFYTCTDTILAGLGKMYAADERFKTNIDKNGEGTAEFISKAIENYCGE